MPDAVLSQPDDPPLITAFASALTTRDPATVRAYLTTVRQFVAWLATTPNGTRFHADLLTETAITTYLQHLEQAGRAPRTRSRALTALTRLTRWAVAEGHLRRNPALAIERPTVVALAPTELSPDQRYVLKSLVERADSLRLAAMFALGYWAGLRISEVAGLRIDHCVITGRAGVITIVEAKGGKTRTLDLHAAARRALWRYLTLPAIHTEAREPDSAFVFTSHRAAWLRQHNQPDHVTTRGLSHQWAALKQQATHVEWERIHAVTFHDLRHDFAHRARAAGWSLEDLAVYLGHQTKAGTPAIMTTARYTLPSREQLKQRLRDLRG